MESKAEKDEKPLRADSIPKIIYLTDDARAKRRGICPYCGEEVTPGADRCDHCSRLLDPGIEPEEKVLAEGAVNFDALGYVKSALASKFEVLEEIARTDTSTVFRATHAQYRREVALKVLLRDVAQDHDFTERFHRRARAIDRLAQDNIITIYDEGVDNGVHYMAMEFLKGTDLQRKIAEHGPLSPEELISILMPAMSALGHAHSSGILHGNIKCSSIFLHNDGRIILFGFGIPHLAKGSQLSFKRATDSIEYLSPEEAAGNGVDGRSDIYSLGVVMYYALTGKLPYSGVDAAATINAIINYRYVPINKLRQIPHWLEDVVDRCLQKDVTKRVQSCGELLGLLNVRPAGQSTSGRQPTRDLRPAELLKKKGIGTQPPATAPITPSDVPPSEYMKYTGLDGGEPPVFEVPPENQPGVEAGEPVSDFMAEPPHPAGSRQVKVEPEGVAEPSFPNRPSLKAMPAVKRKSRVWMWVLAFVLVGILGAGATIVIMNRGVSFNGSAAPVPAAKEIESTKGKTNPPTVKQENANEQVPPAEATSKQVEPSAPKVQEEVRPTETINTASESALPKSRVSSDKARRAVPKPKVSSDEEMQTEEPEPPVVSIVSVPNLTGAQLDVAKSILSLNGFELGTVSSIPDPIHAGLVLRQIPKAGTPLEKGSKVNLIVGSK